MHTLSWVHVDMHTCICTYVHIFRCMQLHVYMHIQVCVDTCIHPFWHMNTHTHMYLLSSSGASQECLKTTAASQGPESASPSGTFTPISEDTVLVTGRVDSVFYLGVICVRCGRVCLSL